MASYEPALVDVTDLKVADKYKILSEMALAPDSLYMRAKDTFKELVDNSGMTKTEYAKLSSTFISGLASQISSDVLRGAMEWATKEKEMAYTLSKLKSDISLNLIGAERALKDLDMADLDLILKKAQATATVASSIRDNGRVKTYAADGFTPLELHDEGAKFIAEMAAKSQDYALLADTYRKSGTVQVSEDTDGIRKGLSGSLAGYTQAQDSFARRQILSFEDSKRSSALSAVSSMMGQLLSSEIAPSAESMGNWNTAMGYLLTNAADTNGDGIPG